MGKPTDAQRERIQIARSHRTWAKRMSDPVERAKIKLAEDYAAECRAELARFQESERGKS